MSRPPMCHAYGRTSSNPQEKGHGEKRQKAADYPGFCELYGFVLCKKSMFDKGKSAFDESNWDDDAALGKFVREAKRGVEVRRGDCLAMEDWDRLARLPWTRLMIRVAELFDAGIHLGDATRKRLIRYDSEDPADAVDLIFGTSRGHGESKRKSHLVQSAKDARRSDAREGEAILTQWLPTWIRIVPCAEDDPEARWYGSVKKKKWGKFALKEPWAGIIRDVFALRKQGLGANRIVKEMIRRGKKSWTGHDWRVDKVSELLRDRRVIGELPPARFKLSKKRQGNGKRAYPAIPGYYPAVISENDFFVVKASNRGSSGGRGRDSEMPNPFKGMIRDALSKETYFVLQIKQTDGTRRPKLLNADGVNGRGTLRLFDYPSFEEAFFRWLREIDSAEVIGESDAGRDVASLSGQIVECEERRKAFLESTRDKKMTPLLTEMAIRLDEELEELKDKLADAQARAEHPLSAAWGEQQSLLAVIQSAADPVAVRLRLRELLKQTVKQIWLLVVPKGRDRIAVVQVDFQGREPALRRTYCLISRQAVRTQHYSRDRMCCELSDACPVDPAEADLSSVKDAKSLAAELSRAPMS